MKNPEQDLSSFSSIEQGELRDTIVATFQDHVDDVFILQNDEGLIDPSEIVLCGTIKTNATFKDIEIVSSISRETGKCDGAELVTITLGNRQYLVTSRGVVSEDGPTGYLNDIGIANLAYWVKHADYHKDLTEIVGILAQDEVY